MSLSEDKLEGVKVEIGSSTEKVKKRLGSGKEGTVYAIEGSRTDVVKIFETDRRSSKQEKLEEMVRNKPDNPSEGSPSLIWPQKIVTSEATGAFLGYSMPHINTGQFQNAQEYARNNLKHSQCDADTRYLSALHLAFAVGVIHVNGHAMGDMHHSNIRVSNGNVKLIDCDGFHISGEQRQFGGATVYPRYEPPDARSEGDDVEKVQLSDQFGLAIHIFQFLMEGIHPFVAVGNDAATGSTKNAIKKNRFPYSNPVTGSLEPPDHAPSFEGLPAGIRDLFEASFIAGKAKPQHRPSAVDWVKALAQASSVDTSGMELDTVSVNHTGSGSNSRQIKWQQQREQRRQQYNSGGIDGAPSEPSTTSSPTGSTTENSSYDRGSKNWAQDIRGQPPSAESTSSDDTSGVSTATSNTNSNYSNDGFVPSGGNSGDTKSNVSDSSLIDSIAALTAKIFYMTMLLAIILTIVSVVLIFIVGLV